MKKKFIVPVRYALILFLLPAGACHKFIDWKDVWQKNKPDCQIQKIITPSYPGEGPNVALFSYNHKGDPVKVERNYVDSSRPHERFLYDNKGRLSTYFGPYEFTATSGYDFYYQYYYDNKNRVILDSFYARGAVANFLPIPNHEMYGWCHYEYDAYERITKLWRIWIVSGFQYFQNEEFFYNEDGNIEKWRTDGVLKGEVLYGPYDNKINLNQTNKVWMFLNRDYSRNNRHTAIAYNKQKLPTLFHVTQPFDGPWSFLYNRNLTDIEIFYDCKK